MEDSLGQMGSLVQKLAKKSMKKFTDKFEGLYDLPDEKAKKVKIGGGTTLYYFKEMGQPPVSHYLTACQKPMLIMQGEKDFQVKVHKDFAAYKELLEGRQNVTFRLYENLNHAFVESVYGSIAKAKQEYGVERHIGENVIADIADWIKAVSK